MFLQRVFLAIERRLEAWNPEAWQVDRVAVLEEKASRLSRSIDRRVARLVARRRNIEKLRLLPGSAAAVAVQELRYESDLARLQAARRKLARVRQELLPSAAKPAV